MIRAKRQIRDAEFASDRKTSFDVQVVEMDLVQKQAAKKHNAKKANEDGRDLGCGCAQPQAMSFLRIVSSSQSCANTNPSHIGT